MITRNHIYKKEKKDILSKTEIDKISPEHKDGMICEDVHGNEKGRKLSTLPLSHGNAWAVPKSLLSFCSFIIIVPEIKQPKPYRIPYFLLSCLRLVDVELSLAKFLKNRSIPAGAEWCTQCIPVLCQPLLMTRKKLISK